MASTPTSTDSCSRPGRAWGYQDRPQRPPGPRRTPPSPSCTPWPVERPGVPTTAVSLSALPGSFPFTGPVGFADGRTAGTPVDNLGLSKTRLSPNVRRLDNGPAQAPTRAGLLSDQCPGQ